MDKVKEAIVSSIQRHLKKTLGGSIITSEGEFPTEVILPYETSLTSMIRVDTGSSRRTFVIKISEPWS